MIEGWTLTNAVFEELVTEMSPAFPASWVELYEGNCPSSCSAPTPAPDTSRVWLPGVYVGSEEGGGDHCDFGSVTVSSLASDGYLAYLGLSVFSLFGGVGDTDVSARSVVLSPGRCSVVGRPPLGCYDAENDDWVQFYGDADDQAVTEVVCESQLGFVWVDSCFVYSNPQKYGPMALVARPTAAKTVEVCDSCW